MKQNKNKAEITSPELKLARWKSWYSQAETKAWWEVSFQHDEGCCILIAKCQAISYALQERQLE